MIKNNKNDRYFVVLTLGEVYVGYGKQDLFNVLFNRLCIPCEVFALKTLEEANTLALQRWPYRFYSTPALCGRTPMPLPAVGMYSQKDSAVLKLPDVRSQTALQGYPAFGIAKPASASTAAEFPDVLEETNNPHAGLTWSIDAMNGYSTAPDLDCLVHYMIEADLVYPHALPWRNPTIALTKAKEAYLARFYRHFDSSKESVSLPHLSANMQEGDLYRDVYYEEREACRTENPVVIRLVAYGLL